MDVKAREGTTKTMRGDERVTYQLFDATRSGLMISTTKPLEQSNQTLDVSSLQPGQYILKVTVGEESVSRQIFIF